jgi:hypothetical protein
MTTKIAFKVKVKLYRILILDLKQLRTFIFLKLDNKSRKNSIIC